MNIKIFTVAIMLVFTSPLAMAQQSPKDLVDNVITDVFQRMNGQAVCMPQGATRDSVRSALKERLNGIDINDNASTNPIAVAIYTTFPCPFSPDRKELSPATPSDFKGNWIFPEPSQKFRHGPKSQVKKTLGMPPIKCEVVSYLDSDEYRSAQILGSLNCPDASNIDLVFQKRPKVASWSTIRNGRIRIDRSDMPFGHIEEWDIFTVNSPFEAYGVLFEKGDLVRYLRREKNNEFNASTMFMHLKKLQ